MSIQNVNLFVWLARWQWLVLTLVLCSPKFLLAASGAQEFSGDSETTGTNVRIRRPIAIESTHLPNRLIVANSASGSLSVINSVRHQRVAEFEVALQAGGLAADQHGRFFLITDRAQARLHCLHLITENQIQPEWEMQTVSDCRTVAVSPNNKQIAVAGHWSRRVHLISVPRWQVQPADSQVINFDFVPGELYWLGNDHLLVLGAYEGRMAVVERDTGKVRQHVVPDHRFSGVALRKEDHTLLLSDQVLNPLARSTRNDVFWGLMIANRISEISVDHLLNLTGVEWLISDDRELGGPKNGKADPAAIRWDPRFTLVTLSGVDQLGVAGSGGSEFSFVDTGRRPVDVIRDGSQAFVVNQLDDSVTVVDLDELVTLKTISLGEAPEPTLAQLGERLFFDGRLSLDGWMSCHSCHVDGHTNGQLNDNFSDGSFGTPKRVLTLLGKSGSAPFAWNGSAGSLEEQIHRSIVSTMQLDQAPRAQAVRAIAAYLKTLPIAPAIQRKEGQETRGAIERGRALFQSLNCTQCHEPPLYTSPQNFDVGLTDEAGLKAFNPPSLLGLGQRDRFFHDNRASSLSELLTDYQHQLPAPLTAEEALDLLAFLRSL